MPTLDSQVMVEILAPSGVTRFVSGRASPVGYFKTVRLDALLIYNSQSPRTGSGEPVIFSSQTIAAGQTVSFDIESFCTNTSGGCGAKVNMQNGSYSVTFSDGSTVNFSVGACP